MCVLHLARQAEQILARDALMRRELSFLSRHGHLALQEKLYQRQLNRRAGFLYRHKQRFRLEQAELNLDHMCHLCDRHNLANQMLLCGVENGENQEAL